MAKPASDSTFLKLNHLDLHGDDAGSQGAIVSKNKKRGQRAAGSEKNGRGLHQLSMKDCEKVESEGRTTYNEVSLMPLQFKFRTVENELVAEFADPINSVLSPDQQQYDEKNIRRRVYDALNVLMAMGIISKDKKEIQWKGLPHTSLNDIEELKSEHLGLRSRIEKKEAYLQEPGGTID
ncbi:Transcription factor-like protein DPB [Quillaja saponaria]|uniref:Transcription factor-like protein DPB n=1 Tax=Quillaja saponaria TaxID=32244 RepID=A0AAD7LE51_QUISA|nr:Transcription factor-like protein DPB [Quillaja saponaria]